MTESSNLSIALDPQTFARLKEKGGDRMPAKELASWLIEIGLTFLETGNEADAVAELAVAKTVLEAEGIGGIEVGPFQLE